MNGVRSRKTVGGVAHDYVTQNGRVIQERYGTTVLQFVYGTDGNPYAMRYSQDSGSTWQTFYYILNLQGDVVKLVDSTGAVCAEYSYDAWGKCLSQTTAASCAVANLADKNPIRYRGYYYDTETGWYYLRARYYDPIVKRFINADSLATNGQGYAGYNMFAYCINNPVRYHDPTGHIIELSTEATEDDVTEYERAIAYLKSCEAGAALIKKLEDSDVVFTITFVDDGDMSYTVGEHVISFDPRCGLLLGDNYSVLSPALCLAHEMGHAAQDLAGLLPTVYDLTVRDALENANLRDYEKPIARQLGEAIRQDYLDTLGTKRMRNSTARKVMHRRPGQAYGVPMNSGRRVAISVQLLM